ncbi:hypothetical protein [Pseudomonas sp. Root562]|uniref:hypothetical protein n=1 Tax=Pseudomonas sp. Root562 TaxID=1736561 RepID=UPI0009E93946|nr:hypothetical protein [Pseudomonas sp. Root562]
MCTLTHFAHPQIPSTGTSSSPYPAALPHCDAHRAPRFQVILAGNAFFHIKEISTGHVRGFRGDHNEACALARALETPT